MMNVLDQFRKKTKFNKKGLQLFLMILPLLTLIFTFSYLPLRGWIYAFYDYRPGIPLEGSEFVGLKHFKYIFGSTIGSKNTIRVLTNTLAMSFLSIAFSWLPMFFAIFLTELKYAPFKKVVQTLTTLPHFVSWVLVFTVAFALFSTTDGLLNRMLISLGVLDKGINYMASGDYVWIRMWAWGLWKGLGWGAIVYIASIAGIDQELYEAAAIDGAGRWQRIWHIMVPQLLPTYFVLLTLSIASLLSAGMEQHLVFQNPMTKADIETLDLYIYNQGMRLGNYSMSTAFGMMKSVISIILLSIANTLSRIVRGNSVM